MANNRELYEKIIDAFISNFILPDEKNITFIITSDGKMISGVPMKTDNEIILGVSVFMMMQIPSSINIDLVREILIDKKILTKQNTENGVFYATNKAVNFTLLVNYINSPKTLSSLREFVLGEHISKCENMMSVINMTIQNESKNFTDAVIIANANSSKAAIKEIKDYVSAGYTGIADIFKPHDKQTDEESYSLLEEIKSLLGDKPTD